MFSYRHFERSEKSFLQSDKRRTSPHFPALFHTASALSAPSGHLPIGKRWGYENTMISNGNEVATRTR